MHIPSSRCHYEGISDSSIRLLRTTGGLVRRHPAGSSSRSECGNDASPSAESDGESTSPAPATAAHGDVLRTRSDSTLDRFAPVLKGEYAGLNKLRRNSSRIYVERIDYRVDSRLGFHLVDEEGARYLTPVAAAALPPPRRVWCQRSNTKGQES